jgi:hypothetical protein
MFNYSEGPQPVLSHHSILIHLLRMYAVSAAFLNSMRTKELLINSCSKIVQIKRKNKSCSRSKCFRYIGVADHTIVLVKFMTELIYQPHKTALGLIIQYCSIILDEKMIYLSRIVHQNTTRVICVPPATSPSNVHYSIMFIAVMASRVW